MSNLLAGKISLDEDLLLNVKSMPLDQAIYLSDFYKLIQMKFHNILFGYIMSNCITFEQWYTTVNFYLSWKGLLIFIGCTNNAEWGCYIRNHDLEEYNAT